MPNTCAALRRQWMQSALGPRAAPALTVARRLGPPSLEYADTSYLCARDVAMNRQRDDAQEGTLTK
jgi:hypothetical protein